MGKNTDQFKGGQQRKTTDERPFLKRGISLADIQNFNRKDYQQRLENFSKPKTTGRVRR